MDWRLTDEEITQTLSDLAEDATYGNGTRAIAQAAGEKALRAVGQELETIVVDAGLSSDLWEFIKALKAGTMPGVKL